MTMKVAPALLMMTAALDIPIEVTVAEEGADPPAEGTEGRRVRLTPMNMMVMVTAN